MDIVSLSDRLSPRELTAEEMLIAADKAIALSLNHYRPVVDVGQDEYVDLVRHIIFVEEKYRHDTDVLEKQVKLLQPNLKSGWMPGKAPGSFYREVTGPDGRRYTDVYTQSGATYSNRPQEAINGHEAY